MKWIAYNIRRTGDINGRPVHTTRTYGPYGQKKHCMQCFFPYGPYVRPVRTGVGTHNPYVRAVKTARTYGRKNTPVRTGRTYGPSLRTGSVYRP